MNRHKPYDFITEKLDQFTGSDTNALWNGMRESLDKKMPVKDKTSKRVMAWIFRFYIGILILSLTAISANYLYNGNINNREVVAASTIEKNADRKKTKGNDESNLSQSSRTLDAQKQLKENKKDNVNAIPLTRLVVSARVIAKEAKQRLQKNKAMTSLGAQNSQIKINTGNILLKNKHNYAPFEKIYSKNDPIKDPALQESLAGNSIAKRGVTETVPVSSPEVFSKVHGNLSATHYEQIAYSSLIFV